MSNCSLRDIYNRKLKGGVSKEYGTLMKDFLLNESILNYCREFHGNVTSYTRIYSMVRNMIMVIDNGWDFKLPANLTICIEEYFKILLATENKQQDLNNIVLNSINMIKFLKNCDDFSTQAINDSVGKLNVSSDIIKEIRSKKFYNFSLTEEFNYLIEKIGLSYSIELFYLIHKKSVWFT